MWLLSLSTLATNCTSWPVELPVEHAKSACPLAEQRNACIESQSGTFHTPPLPVYAKLPEEHTEYCPTDAPSWVSTSPLASGRRVRWIVRNDATDSVTIAWVRHDGMELSALDGQSSPTNAVLQVGEWAVLHVIEGHAFHVRQLPAAGGRLLLRHRAGTHVIRLPIGMLCSGLLPPEEPGTPGGADCLSNDCNVLDRAFVNRAGCPVDLFWSPTDGSCERFQVAEHQAPQATSILQSLSRPTPSPTAPHPHSRQVHPDPTPRNLIPPLPHCLPLPSPYASPHIPHRRGWASTWMRSALPRAALFIARTHIFPIASPSD